MNSKTLITIICLMTTILVSGCSQPIKEQCPNVPLELKDKIIKNDCARLECGVGISVCEIENEKFYGAVLENCTPIETAYYDESYNLICHMYGAAILWGEEVDECQPWSKKLIECSNSGKWKELCIMECKK